MSKRVEKGIKKYKEFNMRDPREIVEIPEVNFPVLVHIGQAEMIAYVSSKEGKETFYKHQFGEESEVYPELYTDPDGKVLIIVGGNFRVKDWIRD